MTGPGTVVALPAGGWWEKRGNTSWVQCTCASWFPVSAELLAPAAPAMHCPYCAQDVTTDTAAHIVKAV